MRLIDADALKEVISGNSYILRDSINSMNFGMFWDGIEQAIDESPTIDATPVVRCKECKWWTKQEKSIQGRCALTGTYPTGGWYCGNGERRDDEIDRR